MTDQAAPETDHERASEALEIVRRARDELHRAVAMLNRTDDSGLLSSPPMIDQAIEYLDDTAGDLEGELGRIEDAAGL